MSRKWNKISGGQEPGETAPVQPIATQPKRESGLMGYMTTKLWLWPTWVWIIIVLVIIIIIVTTMGGLWWWQTSEGMVIEPYIPGTPTQVDAREKAPIGAAAAIIDTLNE